MVASAPQVQINFDNKNGHFHMFESWFDTIRRLRLRRWESFVTSHRSWGHILAKKFDWTSFDAGTYWSISGSLFNFDACQRRLYLCGILCKISAIKKKRSAGCYEYSKRTKIASQVWLGTIWGQAIDQSGSFWSYVALSDSLRSKLAFNRNL